MIYEVGGEFDDLYKSIALLICKTPLTYGVFNKNLKIQTAKCANELKPDSTITQISNLTGIDRNAISGLINTKIKFKQKSKIMILLGDLWKMKDSKKAIKWVDYYSHASKILSSSLSPSEAIVLLEENNCAKLSKCGQYITILKNTFTATNDMDLNIEMISTSIGRHVQTALYNINNKTKQAERLFQQDLRSSQIPPSKQNDLHKEMYAIISDVIWPMLLELIEKYESDVDPGTFPDCGVSAFEFYKKLKV